MDNIKTSLLKMQEIVTIFQEAQPKPINMIEEINNLDTNVVQETLEKYYKNIPENQMVNVYRQEILLNLLSGQKLTLSNVTEFINYRKSIKRFMWSEFSIVCGLYYRLFKVEEAESELSSKLDSLFEESGLATQMTVSKEFDMMGTRQFGSNLYTYAYLEEKYKNGKTSQISLNIDPQVKILAWDSKTDKTLNITIIDTNSETLEADIVEAFKYAKLGYDELVAETEEVKHLKKTWVAKVANEDHFKECLNGGYYEIFFTGLEVGDLSIYKTIEELSEINGNFYNENGNLKFNDRKCLWQFANEIQMGDDIVIALGLKQILAKATVVGEYYYDELTDTHKIPVEFDEEFTGQFKEKFAQKTLTDVTAYPKWLKSIEESVTSGTLLNTISFLNDHKQLIIDGAPGTGKSYGVNTEVKENNINHERVTFYSDYEYHNFIGSILPKLNGETVTYEFVKGPFTKILNDALSRPEDKHYLIVEELTRGNAAAIFGDIFQLLDRTEDGWSEYPITHDNILESLDPEVRSFLENEYEGKIVLPPNLSIICTINSSDQNVYPLDTAFKRRFDYKIESTNVHSDFVDYKIKFGTDITVSWQDFYQKLNKYILVDLGLKEDKQVGPYFIKNHKGDNEKLESIQTKLAMYMWNDLHKVHTISGKTIFKDIHTLYEVDNLFRTGSRQQVLNILSEEFKQHLNLNDSSEITE